MAMPESAWTPGYEYLKNLPGPKADREYAERQKQKAQQSEAPPPLPAGIEPPPKTAAPPGYGKPVIPFPPPGEAAPSISSVPTVGGQAQPSVPGQGEWHTNQNKGAYVQDGQVKGTFEVQPGTGGSGGTGITMAGNANIRQGKTGGGTYNEMSGPGRGSMTAEQWGALSNDERIARNVAAYEGAAKAEHDRWGQKVAAMDGREYDPSTGHIKGMDEGPLVIGQTGGFGLLDNDRELRREAAMSGPLRTEHGRWTDAPTAQSLAPFAGGAGGSQLDMGDMIDWMKLQEQGDYHRKSLGLDAQKFLSGQQNEDRQYGLNAQRTTADVANTGQQMVDRRQEALEKGLTNSGLSQPLVGMARTIAAQQPGLDPAVITSILGEIGGTMSNSTNEGWTNWRNQPYGKLDKFSPDVQGEVLQKFNERLSALRKAQGGK